METNKEIAERIVSEHFAEWKKIVLFLRDTTDREHIVRDVEGYLDKGWDEKRILDWLAVYIPQTYRRSMRALVTYSADTTPEWKFMFEANGLSNGNDVIDRALEKFPNDIDLAYAEMQKLKEEDSKSGWDRLKENLKNAFKAKIRKDGND